MTRAEALAELHEIVDGIDRDEIEARDNPPGGWWETSGGVAFGAERLRLLEQLIARLTPDGADG